MLPVFLAACVVVGLVAWFVTATAPGSKQIAERTPAFLWTNTNANELRVRSPLLGAWVSIRPHQKGEPPPVPTGDHAFDSVYRASGDEARLLSILDDARRAQLVALSSRLEIGLSYGELTVRSAEAVEPAEVTLLAQRFTLGQPDWVAIQEMAMSSRIPALRSRALAVAIREAPEGIRRKLAPRAMDHADEEVRVLAFGVLGASTVLATTVVDTTRTAAVRALALRTLAAMNGELAFQTARTLPAKVGARLAVTQLEVLLGAPREAPETIREILHGTALRTIRGDIGWPEATRVFPALENLPDPEDAVLAILAWRWPVYRDDAIAWLARNGTTRALSSLTAMREAAKTSLRGRIDHAVDAVRERTQAGRGHMSLVAEEAGALGLAGSPGDLAPEDEDTADTREV